MIAEAAPRCTVCGVPVVRAGRLLTHIEQGRTFLVSTVVRPHEATTDPQPDGGDEPAPLAPR